MEKETKEYIDEICQELMHASHQGKVTEVSDLVSEIKKDVKEIKSIFAEHERNFEIRAVNWDNTTKIVYGLVAIMLTALIGGLMALVLR